MALAFAVCAGLLKTLFAGSSIPFDKSGLDECVATLSAAVGAIWRRVFDTLLIEYRYLVGG
jgi:hypothetical protein